MWLATNLPPLSQNTKCHSPFFTNSAIILIPRQTLLSTPLSLFLLTLMLSSYQLPGLSFVQIFQLKSSIVLFMSPSFFFSLFLLRNHFNNSNWKYNTWSSTICSLVCFSTWVKLKYLYMDGILKWCAHYCVICDWNTLQWKGLMH